MSFSAIDGRGGAAIMLVLASLMASSMSSGSVRKRAHVSGQGAGARRAAADAS